MSKKLKPCPFCDGEAEIAHSGTFHWWARCKRCDAETSIHNTATEAIEAWDRRAK